MLVSSFGNVTKEWHYFLLLEGSEFLFLKHHEISTIFIQSSDKSNTSIAYTIEKVKIGKQFIFKIYETSILWGFTQSKGCSALPEKLWNIKN